MRVLIAPDRFAGTLTAAQAAAAIAAGWARTDPDAALVRTPLSDGGPGFADTMWARFATAGGELLAVTVSGPGGEPVPATVVLAGDTAYIEAAQAAGLYLVEEARRAPDRATTYGVGQLLAAAVDAGARRVVVGLGGGAANDGGAGLLAALGAGTVERLGGGGGGLGALEASDVDLAAALRRLDGVELLVATDATTLLHGLRGTTVVSGGWRGVTREQRPELDRALVHWAGLLDPPQAQVRGAGADGGLGYGLLLIGARLVPAIATVRDAVGFDAALADADLVLTGEGSLDWTSRAGRVTSAVAATALHRGVPVVVLAGQVLVGRRELASMGVEAAYAVASSPAELQVSLARPAERLADLAARVARTWSRC
jgi:glycerate kinase